MGTFLTSFVFAAGGGWVAILGFLMLGRLGWRVFVVCTSVPLFLPPILLLHCCLQERGEERGEVAEKEKLRREETVPNIRARIVKTSLFVFINTFQVRLDV